MGDPALDARRPDLRDVRRLGSVRWWRDEKGYGRIIADDGEILFVDFSGVVGDGFRSLDEGQRVSFVWDGAKPTTGGTSQSRCWRTRVLRTARVRATG